VLKLIMALEEDVGGVLEQFADIAAIGTIGDVVPLVGENRLIVKRGLEVMPYTENIGLYKLLAQCGFAEELGCGLDTAKLTAHALSFTACPRINAAGRFAHARIAAELLLAESEELAEKRTAELTALNNTRRDTEAEILAQVDALLTAKPALLAERVLVLRAGDGSSWHKGVIGIIASRVLSRYGKPNIIITNDDEDSKTLRGSARSVEGFPLVPLLEHCSKLLEKFGGHAKAAGFSAKSEHYDELITRIGAYAAEHFPVMPADTLYIDKVLEPADLELEAVEALDALAPFGEGNPVPLYLMQNCVILSKKPLKDGKYLSFNVRVCNTVQKVLCFSTSYSDFAYDIGQHIDAVVTLCINEWNGTRSVSAQLKDCRSAGFSQERYFAAQAAYESFVRNENIDPALSERVVPGKEDIRAVYDALRHSANADRVFAAAGLNYCKFRIVLDVLSECGLIEHDIINNTIKLNNISEKADLETSRTLCKVKALVGVKA
jgi:single-stranded-DNA-specific exonuclease